MHFYKIPYRIVICVVLFIADIVIAQTAFDKTTFPNPITDVSRCGQDGKVSWICDPSNYLSRSEVKALNDTCTTVREFASGCRYTMAVAVVPAILVNGRDLSSSSDSAKLQATEDFARYLNLYAWDFGLCNDGLVVVLAVKSRRVWTHLGTAMQKTLSTKCVNKVFQDNKQLFTDGNYGEGLINLLNTYKKIITEGEAAYNNCDEELSIAAIIGIVIGCLFGAGALGGICWCCYTGKCDGASGGGGHSSHYHSRGHSWGGGGGDCGGGEGGGGDGGADGGGGDF